MEGSSSPKQGKGKEKKKKMVRMTRAQVANILAYEPMPFPDAPQCPYMTPDLQDELDAAFAQAAAAMAASQASLLEEKDWVREQIKHKGYAEYEVDADALPRRRRIGGISVAQLPRHPVKHVVGLGVRKTF